MTQNMNITTGDILTTDVITVAREVERLSSENSRQKILTYHTKLGVGPVTTDK